jgi:DNA-binding winged helix-turn-helix (wHTH) protein
MITVIRLGLIATQASHLAQLQNAFRAASEFQIMELTRPSAPDVLVIDLADQPAGQPQFWITLHGLYPAVALMGVLETPLDLPLLQAALQAGAQYLVAWTDPPAGWRGVARAAFHRQGCEVQREIWEASWALMDAWGASDPYHIRIGALELDTRRRQATLERRLLDLSPLEFTVLTYLAHNAGRLIPPAEFLREVWHDQTEGEAGHEQVRSCLKRLRRKLDKENHIPSYLVAVWGEGWRMCTDVEWRSLSLTLP